VDVLIKNPEIKKGMVDSEGFNCLYYASLYNCLDVIMFLHDQEVSYKPSKKGMTCLHVAARDGHLDLVKFFLSGLNPQEN
jgi:ankyrin repeat protein